MKDPEGVLIWFLRLGGVVMLTALGAVVMPHEWMNVIHRQAGLSELPRAPVAMGSREPAHQRAELSSRATERAEWDVHS